MSQNLLVVESPAKARTISRYLGRDFVVLASMGHVVDLLPKSGSVDTENNFAMRYELIDRNKKHVEAIAKALKKSDALYLATDPDREGEAISWHLSEVMRERRLLKDKPCYRVVFYEVTKSSIQKAIANPRQLSEQLVNAQQARRALDYLVGFNLSPLLWKKVRRGLSAGRVQSPALRLICEREAEIERFIKQEYWTIDAYASSLKKSFTSRLRIYDGEKLSQFSITNEEDAKKRVDLIKTVAEGHLLVNSVVRKQKKRNPAPPFTTSTLQQDASRRFGFAARKTMQLAQQLYDGSAYPDMAEGLITYMRTDSNRISDAAITEIRECIGASYGQDFLPGQARSYRNTTKNAQEAHEAIRPTSIKQMPQELESKLSGDLFKLYSLIWRRTIASQMIHALIDTVQIDLTATSAHIFRANGSTIQHPGFLQVYRQGKDDDKESKDKELPKMQVGDRLPLEDVIPQQHFTEPPPRYTEASLVKTMEEYGIGRPSTYATIIATLQQREYALIEDKRFYPTDTGKVVNNFLSRHFSRYVDYQFTATLEDDLDAISRGEKEWVPVLEQFWNDFSKLAKEKEKDVSREEATLNRELGQDPKSGRIVQVRLGRYGPYVQIGTKDDPIKPLFASLLPNTKMETITLEEALDLFLLPRDLGEMGDGSRVVANIGRYGPYLRYGNKNVAMGDADPYTITLQEGIKIIEEKQQQDAKKVIQVFPDTPIKVLDGRYGPYVTDGSKNARIPKNVDPATISLAEAEDLLSSAKPPRFRSRRQQGKKS